jgi:hypothetical protein
MHSASSFMSSLRSSNEVDHAQWLAELHEMERAVAEAYIRSALHALVLTANPS